MITAIDVNLVFVSHWNFGDKGGLAMYQDKELGIVCRVSGKTRAYFLDEDEREFKTIEDLIEAYNEREFFKKDDINVKWVRVLTQLPE
jgi:hypothetical protein